MGFFAGLFIGAALVLAGVAAGLVYTYYHKKING